MNSPSESKSINSAVQDETNKDRYMYLGRYYFIWENAQTHTVDAVFTICTPTDEMIQSDEFKNYIYDHEWDYLYSSWKTAEQAHQSAQTFIHQTRQLEYGLDSKIFNNNFDLYKTLCKNI